MKALIEIYETARGMRIEKLGAGATEAAAREAAWRYVNNKPCAEEAGQLASGRIVEVSPQLADVWAGDDLALIYASHATLKLVDGLLHCDATSAAAGDALASSYNAAAAGIDRAEGERLERERQRGLADAQKRIIEEKRASGYTGPIGGIM